MLHGLLSTSNLTFILKGDEEQVSIYSYHSPSLAEHYCTLSYYNLISEPDGDLSAAFYDYH